MINYCQDTIYITDYITNIKILKDNFKYNNHKNRLSIELNDKPREYINIRDTQLLYKLIIKYDIKLPVTVNTMFHSKYTLSAIIKNDDNTFTITKNNITPFSVKFGTLNYLVFSSYLFIKSLACINK
jgi:hypothetical protein